MKAIRMKSNVVITSLHPKMIRLLDALVDVWPIQTMWITSGSDGEHSPGSKHYADPLQALDLRRWGLPPDFIHDWPRLGYFLGLDDFDFVVERDHLHVEYDPHGARLRMALHSGRAAE